MTTSRSSSEQTSIAADTESGPDSDSREHFIPFRRQDVVRMCLEDKGLPSEQHKSFRELCEILAAYLHFDLHEFGNAVRTHYAWFDPDRDVRLPDGNDSLEHHEQQVMDLIKTLAKRANFFEVTSDQIREAFESVTLIDLSTHVDLDDFDRVICFARGDVFKKTVVKRWFRKREVDVDVLERVILLIKFKDDNHFQSSRKKRKDLKGDLLKPGSMYVYYYKDVPKFDIELLFPNVKVSMNLRQKLLFAVPAVAGSIGVLFKTLPQLLIVIAVLLFLIGGATWAEGLGVEEEKVTGFMPVFTATFALVVALGGLAVKQWTSYKNKQIEFLKEVSEQLFFRNLATNRSVFSRLIESAEEEESKEMILVLYHLLKHAGQDITRQQLDAEIESWMKEQFGTIIDFDIDGPIDYLSQVSAPDDSGSMQTIVQTLDAGHLLVASLDETKRILDYRWDHFFEYSNRADA